MILLHAESIGLQPSDAHFSCLYVYPNPARRAVILQFPVLLPPLTTQIRHLHDLDH